MKKQLGINFIAQILAFAVNFSVSFFLTPFIVQNIGVDANGFVSLANNFVEYAQLFIIALNSMAARYITIKMHRKETEEASKYFTSVFFATLFLSAVITVIFSVIVVYLDKFLNISAAMVVDIKILWALVFANFIVGVLATNFYVSTFVTDRLDKTAFCHIRGYVIRALILIVCYVFFKPFTFYIGLAMLAMGINNLISHVLYKNKLVPELKIARKYFDLRYIKELIASGIWNAITKLGTILSSGLDLLITNKFVSEVAMGVFSIPKTISNIMISLFGMLGQLYAPELTRLYAEDDKEGMKKQLISSIKVLGLFSGILGSVIVGLGKAFYSLWVPTQDSGLLQILTIITFFNMAIAMPLEPLNNVFTATNKIKASSMAVILFSLASILTVFTGLNFITDNNIKIIFIASVGTLFGVVRYVTFVPLYSAKCINAKKTTFYPVIIQNTLIFVLLSVISLGIGKLINVDSWIKLILAGVLVGVIGLMVNYFLLFSKEERKGLADSVKKSFRK